MKIKIKYPSSNGEIRIENEVDIKEVFVREELMDKDGESVSIGFRNKESSGLIELSIKEFDKLFSSVKGKIHLVKGFKIIRD